MCEKYAKTNKQGKGQILCGIVAEMHVRVKVYDSVRAQRQTYALIPVYV